MCLCGERTVLALTEKITFVMIEHSVSRSRSSHPMIPGLLGETACFLQPSPAQFLWRVTYTGFNFNFATFNFNF
jgi:hypothetical protein